MFSIFRSWTVINTYIDALSRYGIDSRQHDSDVASRVCSDVCSDLARRKLNDAASLEWEIQRAASLVAFCVLGPAEYRQFKGGRHELDDETVRAAARAFSRAGRDAQALDLKIIYTVASFGVLHRSFAVLFCKTLSEQN